MIARNAFPGQKIMPETELYAITDLSRVWVMADVFESDAPQVRLGQRRADRAAGRRRRSRRASVTCSRRSTPPPAL